jgi:hypothetical protein
MRLWLDVYIYNPDGSLLKHAVTDRVCAANDGTHTPAEREIYLEVIANGSQIGQYSCYARVDIDV